MGQGILAFAVFVLIMTWTPGPGNLAMMAIGQTYGLRRAMGFLAGTVAGFTALNVLVAFGLGKAMDASPVAVWTVRILGSGYIVYLAWRIISAQAKTQRSVRPLGFWEGLLIHPVSPKSWAMSAVGFSQFADPGQPLALQAAVFVGTFFCGQFSAHLAWCAAGGWLWRLLGPGRLRLGFSCLLAATMIGTTLYALTMQA